MLPLASQASTFPSEPTLIKAMAHIFT